MADKHGACIHWPHCPICGPRPSTPKIDAVRVARSGVGEYFVQLGTWRSNADAWDFDDFEWVAQDVDDDDPPPFTFGRAMARARDLLVGDGPPDFVGIVNLYQDPHPDHPGCDYCEPGLVAMTARAIATLNEDAGGSLGAGLALQSTGRRARNLVSPCRAASRIWHRGGNVVEGAEGGASDSMALVTIFLEPIGGCAPPWSTFDQPGFEIRLADLLPDDLYVEVINAAVAYVCPV